jgi:transcriptional regulator GlxA family with amidase domain
MHRRLSEISCEKIFFSTAGIFKRDFTCWPKYLYDESSYSALKNHRAMKRQVIKSHDLPFLRQAAEIIRKDLARSFTISDLAMEVGINSTKLREGFKQIYSQTIGQYRLRVKLSKALQLLEDTDLNLAEIAFKAGFDSRDSFGRCFRKQFNQSPREWRRVQNALPENARSQVLQKLFYQCVY